MIYYKLVKISFDIFELVEIIIDIVICHHDLANPIITNTSSLFSLRFWSLFCYFFDIKQRLFTAFYPQIYCQTKRQNSTIEAYL